MKCPPVKKYYNNTLDLVIERNSKAQKEGGGPTKENAYLEALHRTLPEKMKTE